MPEISGTQISQVARNFPKEIVEKRKLLVSILKEAKKNGDDARLIYDKLSINGHFHKS